MWWMAASAGLSLLGAASQSQSEKTAAKAQKLWRDYSNTMLALGEANNQNTITTNQLMVAEASAEEALQIKKGGLLTQAKVEVMAGAAGVKGRSVNQVMLDVTRNAAQAEYRRKAELANANLNFDAQRRSSAMNTKLQTDNSYIPKPNTVANYLNAGVSTFNTGLNTYGTLWDSNDASRAIKSVKGLFS